MFIIGAFTESGHDRVWQAFHVNWMFFATISQAGVIFVAVQRITTARWSRPIVRFLEGYVAFLPIAFLLLIVDFLGAKHIYPWATQEMAQPEKRLYLNPSFLIGRDLLLFGGLAWMSVWYIYRSVRLDVGAAPRVGIGVGARHSRAHAPELPRRAPRDSLDALDAGQARRLDVPRLRLLLFGARLGSLDVARPALQQHALLVVVVHGRVAGRAHELVAALHVVAPLSQRVRARFRK